MARCLDATADVHAELAAQALRASQLRSAGEAYLQAAISYHFSKFVWVLEPERNRRNTEAAVRACTPRTSCSIPRAERIEAPLRRRSVVANLRRPADAAGRRWSC